MKTKDLRESRIRCEVSQHGERGSDETQNQYDTKSKVSILCHPEEMT